MCLGTKAYESHKSPANKAMHRRLLEHQGRSLMPVHYSRMVVEQEKVRPGPEAKESHKGRSTYAKALVQPPDYVR